MGPLYRFILNFLNEHSLGPLMWAHIKYIKGPYCGPVIGLY